MKKKAIIALISAPIIFFVMIFSLIAVLSNWPTIFINPYSLSVLSKYLVPLGIRVSWKDMNVGCTSNGFLDKTISIGAKKMCASVKPQLESGCFDDIQIAFRYKFKGIIPYIVEAGPVSMIGGDISISIPDGDGKKEPLLGEFPIPELKLPKYLSDISVRPVRIKIDSLSMKIAEDVISASADINLETDEDGAIDMLSLSANVSEKDIGFFNAALNLQSESHFRNGDWETDVDASGVLTGGEKVSADASVNTEDGKNLSANIKGEYLENGISVVSSVVALVSSDSLDVSLEGSSKGLSKIVPEAGISSCSLKLKSLDKLKNRGSFDFKCLASAKLKKFELPRDFGSVYTPPDKIEMDISASGESFFSPDLDARTEGNVSLNLRPRKGGLVDMSGRVYADFDGVPSAGFENWKFISDADVDFTIKSFKDLVSVLEQSPWPVPAPFNVLGGSLEFSIAGAMSSNSDKIVFPAKLSTMLESPKQKFFIDSDGKLEIGLKKGAAGNDSLDLNINFEDVQIQLPNLSLAAIPRLVPDSRIIFPAKSKDGSKPASDESIFEYVLNLKTVQGRPIRILSNITPAFIPIALDMKTADDDMSGSFRIESFPVKLFSRSATIDHLNIALAEPFEKSVVIGKMVIPYIDMKILIELAGTVEEPSIILASEPPMSEGDIISMLLYGEPLNALDSDNASSVSNTNMAIAERSMALTSFLLLASTPIQSVAYNPDTKTFSARVKLANKTSLMVGSSSDQKEVGIRQRLGKGWSITTSLEKDDTSQGAASAYIEWSKRY